MESKQRIVLLLSCAVFGIGATAAPLLLRFYFLHGGSLQWFSSWLQAAAFPILILPISISYYTKRHRQLLTPTLSISCIGLGMLSGSVGYMFAWGISYLSLSTSSLLISTQLGFNAIFAYILVRHKFTPFSINAVILLTMAPILLAFHSSSDRPQGTTNTQYWLGFVVTIGADAISGLISPLIELVIKKTGRRVLTYTLVMEMQLMISFTATVFFTVGMVVNKDFQAIAREARASDVGEFNYYMAVVWCAVWWQLSYIGLFGVIFLSSSLLSGLVNAAFMTVTEVVAVIIYHEKFSAEKGMAVAMALWGITSYLYGEHKGSQLQVSNMNMTENGDSASLGKEEETVLELS